MDQAKLAIFYNAMVIVSIWGGALLALLGHRRPGWVRLIISFSAGLFMGVAFIHMLPEASELLGSAHTAGLFLIIGYLLVYVLERFVMVHPCEEEECDYHHVGLAAFVGLSVHSLINGLALGAALLVPGLGVAVLTATVTHKAPESFSLSSLLILGKRPMRQVLTYIAAFSLMVPLGVAIAVMGLAPFGSKVIGAAVAMSSGTFLQIATGDLLPETHATTENRWRALGAMIAGLGVALFTKSLEH